MLWDVADWDREGGGPWAEPLGPGFERVGGVRTEVLKEARMEDRMSRCSLDGCRTRAGFRPAICGTAGPGYLHGGAESSRPRA